MAEGGGIIALVALGTIAGVTIGAIAILVSVWLCDRWHT